MPSGIAPVEQGVGGDKRLPVVWNCALCAIGFRMRDNGLVPSSYSFIRMVSLIRMLGALADRLPEKPRGIGRMRLRNIFVI